MKKGTEATMATFMLIVLKFLALYSVSCLLTPEYCFYLHV